MRVRRHIRGSSGPWNHASPHACDVTLIGRGSSGGLGTRDSHGTLGSRTAVGCAPARGELDQSWTLPLGGEADPEGEGGFAVV
eukprot:124711-Prymnesium_polylepis.1